MAAPKIGTLTDYDPETGIGIFVHDNGRTERVDLENMRRGHLQTVIKWATPDHVSTNNVRPGEDEQWTDAAVRLIIDQGQHYKGEAPTPTPDPTPEPNDDDHQDDGPNDSHPWAALDGATVPVGDKGEGGPDALPTAKQVDAIARKLAEAPGITTAARITWARNMRDEGWTRRNASRVIDAMGGPRGDAALSLGARPAPGLPTLADHIRHADNDDHQDDEPTPEPTPTPTPVPTPDGATIDPDALAALAAILTPKAPPVDMDAVRAAAAEAGKDAAALAIAEHVRPLVVVKVEGLPDAELPDVHHHALADVVTLLALAPETRQSVYLVGPAGTGKSTIGEQAADALGIPFAAQSCHPMMAAHELMGYRNITTDAYVSTPFRDAYEHGHLFLLDEIDNAHPSILAGMNSALSNGAHTFPDGHRVPMHPDFRAIATANTYGTGPDAQYVGRNALDAATLDRFITVDVDYDEDLERAIAEAKGGTVGREWARTVQGYRAKARDARLQVIISTRAIIAGSVLLAAGQSERDVRARVFARLTDDQRRTIGAA